MKAGISVGYVFLLCLLFSCKKKDSISSPVTPPPPTTPTGVNKYIQVSDSVIMAKWDSSEKLITILSNTDWQIINNSKWLKCDKVQGTSDGHFILSWAANANTTRTDSIIISGGNIRIPIVINQASVFLFTGTSFGIGNQSLGEKNDTLFFHFNKPVKTVNFIRLVNSLCSSTLFIDKIDDGKTVRLLSGCNPMGSANEYDYSVTDEANNTITGRASFSICTRVAVFAGQIQNYFVTDDDQYVWIATMNPGQIHCISTSDTSFRKSFNIDFIPSKVVYNTYNKRLYILASISDRKNSKYISVMNPANGQIEKKIEVKTDQFDHPYQPEVQDVFPVDIAIGANGYGVILIQNYSTSAQRWKVIDTRLNDSIYIHPVWDWGNIRQSSFGNACANFDGSQIILRGNYGMSRFDYLDCQTGAIREIIPSAGYNLFLKPNRVKNDIYIGHNFYQFIWHENGNESVQSQLDARSATSAEFNYKPDGDGIIYWINQDGFQILNYNKQQIVYSHLTAWGLLYIFGTKDGSYLFANSEHGFYFFNTNLFHY